MDDKWRKVTCVACDGYGNIWSWADEGAMDCPHCFSGLVYIRPSGQVFEYPGGKAMGSWGKEEYKDGIPVMPYSYHENLSWESYEELPLDFNGAYPNTNPARCICGWEGTLETYYQHYEEAEKEFVILKKSQDLDVT